MSALLESIRQRLRDQVPALKVVDGAAGFQRATEALPFATPAAYVLLAEESADEGSIGFDQIQMLTQTISLISVVRNVSDPQGASAQTDIDALREAIRTAILGFVPDTGHLPLTFRQGQLLAFRDGHAWWQDSYHTATTLVSSI